jgi:hypothetical protein
MKIPAIVLTASIILIPAAAASQPATTATDQSAAQTQDNPAPDANAPAVNAPATTAQADATCAKPGKSGSAKASGDTRPDSVKSVTRDTGELATTKAKKPDKETACADQPQ